VTRRASYVDCILKGPGLYLLFDVEDVPPPPPADLEYSPVIHDPATTSSSNSFLLSRLVPFRTSLQAPTV